MASTWLRLLGSRHSIDCARVVMRRRSAVRVDLRDELFEHGFGLVVVDLARAGAIVATTAVLEHQIADVRLRASIEDRLARREHGVLLLQAPNLVDGDVALREQRVDGEAIRRPDGLLVEEVEDDEVLVDGRAALDLLLRLRLVLAI